MFSISCILKEIFVSSLYKYNTCFPRCQASCVAVTSCIALMLQHNAKSYSSKGKTTPQNVKTLIAKSYEKACTVLETEEQVNTSLK